jgi:predicted Zn-dependent protease with MMP-like domain
MQDALKTRAPGRTDRAILRRMIGDKAGERRDAALDEALDAVERLLADGDFAGARAALARAGELAGADHPEVLFAEACIAWDEHGPTEAAELLERVVEVDHFHADAHHALARCAEERGDSKRAIEHFLHVHKLDAKSDREARLGTRSQLDHIDAVAREVLNALPSPFVERLEHVPVVLERRPSRALIEDGFDPRSLGLFEGAIDGDSSTPTPTRIVLFVNNLLAEFPEDPELSEEIEITLLHEIGHFFGLDEDDMERLGLD